MVHGAVQYEQGAGEPEEGSIPYPGREILWRTSKLMPGGLKGFKQERPRRGCSRRSSEAEAQEAKGVGTFLTEVGWKEALVGRARDKNAEARKGHLRNPKTLANHYYQVISFLKTFKQESRMLLELFKD